MNQQPVLRQCVACRKRLDRRLLVRVIRDHQNGIVLEKGMGRSAYVCPNESCLEDSLRRKRLQKALRCQVPVEILEMLQKNLNPNMIPDSEAR